MVDENAGYGSRKGRKINLLPLYNTIDRFDVYNYRPITRTRAEKTKSDFPARRTPTLDMQLLATSKQSNVLYQANPLI